MTSLAAGNRIQLDTPSLARVLGATVMLLLLMVLVSRAIVAMARDVDTDGIVSTSVRVRLEFDPSWRLTSRLSEAVFTCP